LSIPFYYQKYGFEREEKQLPVASATEAGVIARD